MKIFNDMMEMMFQFSICLALLARCLNAQQIVNGQIFTPGIAIVDAPQPNTPLGGGESLNQIIPFAVAILTRDRLPASCSRRVLRWPTSTPTLPIKPRFCNLEYHDLPLKLRHRLEFHDLERHCDGRECEFR
jgi:hypothetical protein